MDAENPIRAFRAANKISAAELARRVGVARNTVWRWEKGRQGIAPKLWAYVSRQTGIAVERLAMLGNTPPVTPAPIIHESEPPPPAQRSREALAQQLDDARVRLARQRVAGRPAERPYEDEDGAA
jgi:transcriptional regulator with XRE-family HTH domain